MYLDEVLNYKVPGSVIDNSYLTVDTMVNEVKQSGARKLMSAIEKDLADGGKFIVELRSSHWIEGGDLHIMVSMRAEREQQ